MRGNTAGVPFGEASMTSPGKRRGLGRMGFINWRGMCQYLISSSVRMKKLLEPVASPRLIAKMSPRVGSPVSARVVVAENLVHLQDRRNASRGTCASVCGCSIGPANENLAAWPEGGGDLRNTTTAEDTRASVNWTSVGQKR